MRTLKLVTTLLGGIMLSGLAVAGEASPAGNFEFKADRFADIQVLRYRVPDFDKLSLKQKTLAYYLYEAGLAGRDIFWDQKYRYNLTVRKTLEAALRSFRGERSGANWEEFLTYAKEVFFANGIHHHYGSAKMLPAFPPDYLATLVSQSDSAQLPLAGKSVADFTKFLTPIV